MLGFTKQELLIVTFLILSLLVGTSVKLYKQNNTPAYRESAGAESAEFKKKVAEIDSLDFVAKSSVVPKRTKSKPAKSESKQSKEDAATVAVVEKIDINKASVEELQKIPKIGPVLAQKIIEHRTQNGDFEKIEDMINVKGIGEKTLIKIKDYLILEQVKN